MRFDLKIIFIFAASFKKPNYEKTNFYPPVSRLVYIQCLQ
jgi:hypothetical protein